MQRLTTSARPDWETIVESQGFHFHTPEGQPYWDETAYYRFTAQEIDQIERATEELDQMCLTAVEHVIETRRFEPFGWSTVGKPTS
jgi:glutathionylspermidine synthase